MTRVALIACLVAAPALAQDDTALFGVPSDLGATSVRLQPTDAPDAVAEVVFVNAQINKDADEGVSTLVMGDLIVEVTFGFNVAPGGADSITVVPPPGYYADPPTLVVTENDSGTVLIYQYNMM